MKFFEKNIKDRFKNASSLNGVEPDDLWKNIESSISTESPKSNILFFRKRYLLLLVAFFIIGGATFWNLKSKESISKIAKSDSEKITNSPIQEEKNIELKNVTQVKKDDAKEEKNIEDSAFIPSVKLENSLATIPSKSNHKNQSTTPIIKKNNNSISTQIQNTNLVNDEIDEQKIQNTFPPIQKDVLKNEPLFDVQKIDFTKIAFTNFLLPNQNGNQLGLNGLINPANFDDKKSKFSIGIFTGTHTLKNNFSTTLASKNERSNSLNKSFQYELGHSFALEASIHFNKNIFITSGIEYLKSKSEFNFVQEWDTIIVNPNSPVGILTDAFAVRTVKHHNKMEYFSMPILLGLNKSFGQIEVGISAGVGLNFTKSQTGKSLNFSNQIDSYPNGEVNLLPVSNFFLSYHFRPYLNFALGEKISFQLRTDFRYQNFGESNFYQLNYSSIFLGLSGGVQYTF